MARRKIEPNISYDDQRGCYYVYMDYGTDESGTRIRHYKTFPNLQAARKALREFHAERAVNQDVTPQKLTLEEWLRYWMKEVIGPNRAVTTLYGYQKIIENHLGPALGDVPIQKLTPRHLQGYYTLLLRDKGLSPNTVRRHHDLLSAALHAAVRHDILLRSPTERVEPPRTVQPEIGYYGPSELKELYFLVQDTWLEVIVKLAGSLGLRREEICGLKWDCVDFQQRKIHICQARTAAGAVIVEKETKTRASTRALYMTDDVYFLLKRERSRQAENRLRLGPEWKDTGLVAVDRRGKPYSPNAVSLAFTRFIRKNHLPKLTLHGLRHTFATVASAQGAPLFDIGRALGHSTPSTTGRIYTHLLDHTHASTLGLVADALK